MWHDSQRKGTMNMLRNAFFFWVAAQVLNSIAIMRKTYYLLHTHILVTEFKNLDSKPVFFHGGMLDSHSGLPAWFSVLGQRCFTLRNFAQSLLHDTSNCGTLGFTTGSGNLHVQGCSKGLMDIPRGYNLLPNSRVSQGISQWLFYFRHTTQSLEAAG